MAMGEGRVAAGANWWRCLLSTWLAFTCESVVSCHCWVWVFWGEGSGAITFRHTRTNNSCTHSQPFKRVVTLYKGILNRPSNGSC